MPQLGGQRREKAGVFAQFYQTHFAAQAQLPEWVPHVILIRCFLQRWRAYKASICSSPSAVGRIFKE
jgi:hypothetical protein